MEKKPHILIVSRALPFHGLGGMEAIAWDLAKAFAAAGSYVTALTTAGKDRPAEFEQDGIRVHYLNTLSGRYSREWWKQSTRVFVEQYSQDVDIVLSVGAGARAMVHARHTSRALFISQCHGAAWGAFISKIRQMTPLAWAKSLFDLAALYPDMAYRKFDAFVAVGQLVEKELTTQPMRYVVGDVPVHLIVNGVDTENFKFDSQIRAQRRARLGLSENARVVFSASRLHPQKGVMEGIEGFLVAARENPDLHYVIAGAGTDEARLRERVSSSGMAERIHFAGSIPREQLGGWLSAADVFLFTTKRLEGLPLNILEALAAGLPLVASRHVADPRYGALAVEPDDSAQVGKAILAALATPAVSRESRLPAEFTLAHSARCYLQLFDQLLLNRPGPAAAA